MVLGIERFFEWLPERPSIRYALATAIMSVAIIIRALLGLLADDVAPFATLYPAVVFVTLLCGFGPGLVVGLAGGIVAWWAFMPPLFAFSPISLGQQLTIVAYSCAVALIAFGAELYRATNKRLSQEERLRKLAVDELAHRLKNKIATIHAIVRLRLRDHPVARDEILSSLSALSKTDDLILAVQGCGADVRSIILTEVGPYGPNRITLTGPEIVIPANIALTMALLVHELATNAAKYGAFSTAVGSVSIAWSFVENTLQLQWKESGGPPVTPPTRTGFGSRLITAALQTFGGSANVEFASGGLICNLSVPISGADNEHAALRSQGAAVAPTLY